MTTYIAALWGAVVLGILTSISPCPLATNIAAVSYISKKTTRPGMVILSGVLYSIGRTIAYVFLAAILIAGLASIPSVSRFMQYEMNKYMGPVLIVVGMFLLGLLTIKLPGMDGAKYQKLADRMGVAGALFLGMLFAMAFCPITAVYFFLNLIPLAAKHGDPVFIPLAYGIATGLPVVGFAVLIAVSTQKMGKAFNKVAQVEWWVRNVAGVVFILVGIYYSMLFIYGVNLPWFG